MLRYLKLEVMPSVGGYHQARHTYFKRDYVLPMTMISNCYQITESFPYKTTTTMHTVILHLPQYYPSCTRNNNSLKEKKGFCSKEKQVILIGCVTPGLRAWKGDQCKIIPSKLYDCVNVIESW